MRNGTGTTFSDFSASGTPRKIQYGNGVTTTYNLNVDGSAGGISIVDPSGKTLLARGYAWDQLGRLQSVSNPTMNPP